MDVDADPVEDLARTIHAAITDRDWSWASTETRLVLRSAARAILAGEVEGVTHDRR